MNKTTLLILSLLVILAFAIGCKKLRRQRCVALCARSSAVCADLRLLNRSLQKTPAASAISGKEKVKTPSASMPKQKPIESQTAEPVPEKRVSRLAAFALEQSS